MHGCYVQVWDMSGLHLHHQYRPGCSFCCWWCTSGSSRWEDLHAQEYLHAWWRLLMLPILIVTFRLCMTPEWGILQTLQAESMNAEQPWLLLQLHDCSCSSRWTCCCVCQMSCYVMSLSCACTDTRASFLAVTIASYWLVPSHCDTACLTNLLVTPCGIICMSSEWVQVCCRKRVHSKQCWQWCNQHMTCAERGEHMAWLVQWLPQGLVDLYQACCTLWVCNLCVKLLLVSSHFMLSAMLLNLLH